jgi:hypothetical protein
MEIGCEFLGSGWGVRGGGKERESVVGSFGES